MKKALVLAGGIAQAALIGELKVRGYRTLLADMNPDCYAAKLADEFHKVSAMDFDALEQLAREQQVDMILTACADQILLAETYLCEKLGMRSYISYETAKKVSDKKAMKDIFARHGIPTSRHVMLAGYSEQAIAHLRYPLVVKPADAYSSRGVRKCSSPEEVREYLGRAIEISRTKTAIVEEYLEGQELTAEFFVREGKAALLCCGSKEKLKDGRFVSYGSIYPSAVSDELRLRIVEVGQMIADAFGLVNSPMLVQFITDGKEAYVLEACARTGGFIKHEIVRRMSGFDPIAAIVDLHEGTVPAFNGICPEKNYLISCFLYCSEGVFEKAAGFEEALNNCDLSRYWIVRKPGYEFKGIETNGDRAACFITQDDTLDGLLEKYRRARETVKILDAEGHNLIRFDLM